MLTAEGCRARRQRLWQSLAEPYDCLVLSDPPSLMHLANFHASPFVFRSVRAPAFLILERDGPSILVVDNIQEPFAELAHVDEFVAPHWYRGDGSPPHRMLWLIGQATARLGSLKNARLGLEASSLPAAFVKRCVEELGQPRWEPIDAATRRLRRAKDGDEVTLLRQSMAAGEAGHAAALRELRPGMSEVDAFLLVQQAAARAISAPVEVYGDFASGPRCLQGGGPATSRVIQPGEPFLLDFSVVHWQYRGDFSNTFIVGEKPTDAFLDLHGACQSAMAVGESLLRPGAPAAAIHAAILHKFATTGRDAFFPHHAGHGVGLAHPEPPFLTPNSRDVLEIGDVLTLEPGLYVPGIGGARLERNYLITADGFETLSRHVLAPATSS